MGRSVFLRFPGGLQITEAMRFARPFKADALSEGVVGRLLFQINVAGVLHRKFHLPDFYGRMADGPSEAHANGVHTMQGTTSAAFQVHPGHGAGMVEGGSHVMGRVGKMGKILQRNGKAVPGARDIGHYADVVIAGIGGKSQVQPLGCGNLVFQHDIVIPVPIGGKRRVDLFQGELCPGYFH